jgi:hypothetical protein
MHYNRRSPGTGTHVPHVHLRSHPAGLAFRELGHHSFAGPLVEYITAHFEGHFRSTDLLR